MKRSDGPHLRNCLPGLCLALGLSFATLGMTASPASQTTISCLTGENLSMSSPCTAWGFSNDNNTRNWASAYLLALSYGSNAFCDEVMEGAPRFLSALQGVFASAVLNGLSVDGLSGYSGTSWSYGWVGDWIRSGTAYSNGYRLMDVALHEAAHMACDDTGFCDSGDEADVEDALDDCILPELEMSILPHLSKRGRDTMLNQLIKNVLRLSGVVLLPGLLITACEQAPVTDIDDQEVPSVTEFLRSMNPVDAPNVKFGGTPTRLVKPSMYIDGHLVTADNMGVYEDMQPDDIESVRLIVKDAARAKYGQDVHRAMEITLKKGWQNNR